MRLTNRARLWTAGVAVAVTAAGLALVSVGAAAPSAASASAANGPAERTNCRVKNLRDGIANITEDDGRALDVAIDRAEPGDVLRVEGVCRISQISLRKRLTIVGGGGAQRAVVEGYAHNYISLLVYGTGGSEPGPDLTLKRLDFTVGQMRLDKSSKVRMWDVRLHDGQGLYTEAYDLKIFRSTFDHNYDLPAIWDASRYKGKPKPGTTLHNSEVHHNSGGGIRATRPLVVTKSSVHDNEPYDLDPNSRFRVYCSHIGDLPPTRCRP